jgi:glycine cleavage system transcriptional repressor
MASVALVSILCLDQTGLVAAIADHLFEEGVNLRDTNFAVLGRGAEFTSVCELPEDETAEGLEAGLAALPELAAAQVRVVAYAYDPLPGPMGKITHRIEVDGGDQLGLIARLAMIFTQNGANIVRLDAQKLADRADMCLAAVANTAGSLGLASRAEPASA